MFEKSGRGWRHWSPSPPCLFLRGVRMYASSGNRCSAGREGEQRPAEGGTIVGEFGQDGAPVGERMEAHLHLFIVVSLADIGYLKPGQSVLVVEIEAPLVEQQLDVARGVDMAVEIYVAVGEAVGDCLILCQRPQACRFSHGTHLVGRDVGRHPLHVGYIGGAAGVGVKYGPHRAGVSDDRSLPIGNLEVALREEAVYAADPCGDGVVVVDTGVAGHFHRHAAQHPCLMAVDEGGISDAELVGVEGGNLYEAVYEQGDGHPPLGITLGGGQEISAAEGAGLGHK